MGSIKCYVHNGLDELRNCVENKNCVILELFDINFRIRQKFVLGYLNSVLLL